MKKMMNLLAMALVVSGAAAQHIITSETYGFSFETTEKLEPYDTEADRVIGFESVNYAVDIEIVPLEEETEDFLSDISYGAYEIADYMGFDDIQDGGTIPHIATAYYVTTQETYDGVVPVYILAVINEDLGVAYEATVYCYNGNKEEGLKIVKSFRLL